MSAGDPREERLPKWARAELDVLRRRLHEAEADARRLRESALSGLPADESTDTYADPYAEHPIRLRPGEAIQFVLGDGPEDYVQARIEREERRVLISTGWRGLMVQPVASNTARVYLARE